MAHGAARVRRATARGDDPHRDRGGARVRRRRDASGRRHRRAGGRGLGQRPSVPTRGGAQPLVERARRGRQGGGLDARRRRAPAERRAPRRRVRTGTGGLHLRIRRGAGCDHHALVLPRRGGRPRRSDRHRVQRCRRPERPTRPRARRSVRGDALRSGPRRLRPSPDDRVGREDAGQRALPLSGRGAGHARAHRDRGGATLLR